MTTDNHAKARAELIEESVKIARNTTSLTEDQIATLIHTAAETYAAALSSPAPAPPKQDGPQDANLIFAAGMSLGEKLKPSPPQAAAVAEKLLAWGREWVGTGGVTNRAFDAIVAEVSHLQTPNPSPQAEEVAKRLEGHKIKWAHGSQQEREELDALIISVRALQPPQAAMPASVDGLCDLFREVVKDKAGMFHHTQITLINENIAAVRADFAPPATAKDDTVVLRCTHGAVWDKTPGVANVIGTLEGCKQFIGNDPTLNLVRLAFE